MTTKITFIFHSVLVLSHASKDVTFFPYQLFIHQIITKSGRVARIKSHGAYYIRSARRSGLSHFHTQVWGHPPSFLNYLKTAP